MKYKNEDNITIDEHIKYLEEKRNAFNRLVIAMQEDAKKKDADNNVKKGQMTMKQ
jgi:hypothetical protein